MVVFAVLAVVATIDRTLGLVATLLICAVAIWTFFIPKPKLKLTSKTSSICLLLFAGIPGLAVSLAPVPEKTDWQVLKANDPEEYLAKLEELNFGKFADELETMRPQEFARREAEIEAWRARQAELKMKAAEQSKIERQAAKAKQQRLTLKRQQEQQRLKKQQLAEAELENQKEQARKAKLAAKVHQMTQQVVAKFETSYGFTPQPYLPNQPMCREDNYCAINAEDFHIQIYGAGIVTIDTTFSKPQGVYRETCSAVFSAISGIDLDFSAQQMESAFLRASQTGPVKFELQGVEGKVSQDSNGLLECRFFKF